MKRAFLAVMMLIAPGLIFAQEPGTAVFFQSAVPATAVGVMGKPPGAPVQGAPYSATSTNETVQILSDGTRIVQTSTGNIARDSQGRTRQDTTLPAIGNLSAADAPHMVFIQDPVAQTAYTLNPADKTAQKMPAFPMNVTTSGTPGAMTAGPMTAGKFTVQIAGSVSGGPPPMPMPPPPPGMMLQRTLIANDQGQMRTEELGTQSMENVLVSGVRTTRTIPTGEIGNDRPISIVTEVWTSPDLKTIVYSKRTDPRMGELTFRLTNIVRAEPDASLFTVPGEFTLMDGPRDVLYRSNQ